MLFTEIGKTRKQGQQTGGEKNDQSSTWGCQFGDVLEIFKISYQVGSSMYESRTQETGVG